MSPAYAQLVEARSPAQSADEEQAQTIDLLRDERWQPLTWFSDFAFATRNYTYGALFGPPTHLPDSGDVQADVLEAVAEAEEHAGGGGAAARGEPSTAVELLRRMCAKPTMLAIRFLGYVLGKLWRAAFTSVLLHNVSIVEETFKRVDKVRACRAAAAGGADTRGSARRSSCCRRTARTPTTCLCRTSSSGWTWASRSSPRATT
jgi:hypothetical protein